MERKHWRVKGRAGEGVERGEETGTLLQALCLRGEERGPWEEATGRWDRR